MQKWESQVGKAGGMGYRLLLPSGVNRPDKIPLRFLLEHGAPVKALAFAGGAPGSGGSAASGSEETDGAESEGAGEEEVDKAGLQISCACRSFLRQHLTLLEK